MKLPFGICQIGKAFRNEVVARQFVFRILTVDYNKEKDTLEVAYKTSEGEEKVHCTNYGTCHSSSQSNRVASL